MRVKIAKQPERFEPIKLTVTIETPEELCDLWLRMNLSGISVDKENGCYLKHCAVQAENEKLNGFPLWTTLDNLIGERNLRHEESQ